MLSDDEPRGGNVSGVLFIDADGELVGTGPSKPSPWAMMAAKLFRGFIRVRLPSSPQIALNGNLSSPDPSYEPVSADLNVCSNASSGVLRKIVMSLYQKCS